MVLVELAVFQQKTVIDVPLGAGGSPAAAVLRVNAEIREASRWQR